MTQITDTELMSDPQYRVEKTLVDMTTALIDLNELSRNQAFARFIQQNGKALSNCMMMLALLLHDMPKKTIR